MMMLSEGMPSHNSTMEAPHHLNHIHLQLRHHHSALLSLCKLLVLEVGNSPRRWHQRLRPSSLIYGYLTRVNSRRVPIHRSGVHLP